MIAGLVPILATPFHPDGSLDLPGLRRLTEFQLRSGVDGVAVFGMASEGFALRAAERQEILSAVLDVVAGEVPVVAGIAETSFEVAEEQAQEFEGVQALMVLPPFLVRPTAQQLVEFYGRLGAVATAPIMVQDSAVTGVTMPPSLIEELSGLDGVTSVKVEVPPTAAKVGAVRTAIDDLDFAVLGGQNAQFCLDEYAAGAVGTMPACEFSDVLAPILAQWVAGDRVGARQGLARLLPLIVHGLQPGLAWAVHKEVLVRRGLIDDATVRAPSRELDAVTRRNLDGVLQVLDLPPVEP
ncbi:dihydrodipicolinate synthase family protein [Ruania alba]|uniref:4-hydroxy-tetrahydrodipicolinate synthase n=1 Tax=Ruania alba TaxID=648782 RepID=A0A1H5MY39_9MICO|nr:dihydrodipicolinate synthase family protein [Ruania alba]SEE94279.1 4-hydroxy-tetrahydrodipicolinate synthase [Ruania alba]